MKRSRRLLYLACLIGLAATSGLAVARVGTPSIAAALLWVVIVAALAGSPGLVRRKAWPLALVLLPLGAYVVVRTQLSPPATVHGPGEQWTFYVQQLRDGAHAYATHHLPFDLAAAPELKLLLALLVYWAAAAAAFLALSLRRALPAIAILLALLGFGLTIDEAARVVWLPLMFLLLAGCLLMLSRSLERERWKPGDALAGGATALIASLLALTLLGTTPVAAGKPWQDWRTWGGGGGQDFTSLVFDWMENYPGLLDPESNAEVMRVRSPVATYWRANALDSFTGATWFSAQHGPVRLQASGSSGSSAYAVPALYPEPPGKLVTMVFESKSLSTDYYFTGGAPRTLVIDRDRPPYLWLTDAHALWMSHRLGPGLSYKLTAVVPQIGPADLIDRGRDYPEDLEPYRLLPFRDAAAMTGPAPEREWRDAMNYSAAAREWQGLYALNREIVGAATDPYQIALRIEEYLRFNYAYSLTPPDTAYQSPYAAFLFDTKTGYCQHFAGAMAALLRFNGIPARVAVGFTSGSRITHDTFVVTRNDAHSWVEVYFPGVGWVAFDPTPGRNLPGPGPSSTSAGFVGSLHRCRRRGRCAAGSSLRRTRVVCSRTRPRGMASAAPVRRSRPPGAPAGSRGPSPSSPLAVSWPAARMALRQSRARRGGLERRLRASLALLYADIRDFGVKVPASRTLEETARQLRESLGVDATTVVDRVQAVLFGGRVATDEDVAEVARLRRQVRRRLRERRGWTRTLAALYGLPALSGGRG